MSRQYSIALAMALCLGVGLIVSCKTKGAAKIENSAPKPAPSADTWIDAQSGLEWQVLPTSAVLNWDEASKYCESLTLSGHSDWRVPSISELRSLLRGCPATEKGGSCGVTDLCPNFHIRERGLPCWDEAACQGCSKKRGPGPGGVYWPRQLLGEAGSYWTGSVVWDLNSLNRWAIDFDLGGVGVKSEGAVIAVRCVRFADAGPAKRESRTPTSPPSGDIWKDPASGLTWQTKSIGGEMNLPAAQAHCRSLSLGGRSDWRLPTIDGLRSLIRGCRATENGGSCAVTNSCLNGDTCWKNACWGCPVGSGPGSGGAYWPSEISSGDRGFLWYWSSSAAAGHANSEWIIEFDSGSILAHDARTDLVTRCVR